MKRWILLMIVLMMPLAFADSDNGNGNGNDNDNVLYVSKAKGEIKDAVKEKVGEVRNEANKVMVQKRQELKERLQKFNEEKKEEFFEKFKKEGFKARELVKERVEERKELLKQRKEGFIGMKGEFKASKQEMESARKAKLECSGDCDEKAKAYREKFKENMLDRVDAIINHLEQLKLKVESSETIDEKEAEDLINDIEKKIDIMDSVKVELENAETKEEILRISKNIRNKWESLEYQQKIFAARIVNANLGNAILRAKHLEQKLERFKERLEGEDTSEIDALIDEFKTHVEAAKENYRKAHEELKGLGENDKGVSGVKELIRESNRHMEEANGALQKIIVKIKEMNKVGELNEASDDVEEEEVEL